MKVDYLKNWPLFLAMLLLSLSLSVFAREAVPPEWVAIAQLPREAQQALSRIKQGGPFPYAKDGAVFRNFEQILPRQPRGYYHEYTVTTPWVRHRGARRLIAGGEPTTSGEYYYTQDHYASFARIKE